MPDHSLAEVVYEQKYTASNEFQMELAAKMKVTGDSFRIGKVALIKNLNTGAYSLAAGYEFEEEVGKIKYCNFLTIGAVSVGAEIGAQSGANNAVGLSGSASGYIKLSAFAVASYKFTVFKF